jgi:hypothetical protein
MKTSSTQSACPQHRHRYRYQSLGSEYILSSMFSIGRSATVDLLKQGELFNDTIVRMKNQFQRHFVSASRADKRVFPEALKEPLNERFHRQDPIAVGVVGHISRQYISKLPPAFSISYVCMQAVISDSLKTLWQNMLHHSFDELQHRQGFVFDLSGFVVSIPVADVFSVISFNSSHGDRRRDDVFGEIFCESLSARRNISRLKVCDESFGIIFPAGVDILFNIGIVNIFPEHAEQMELPFFVHDAVRYVRNRLPFTLGSYSASRHEYMEMRVVMAGPSCSLKNDDASHVEFDAATCSEYVFETLIAGPHENIEQCGIITKIFPQIFRSGQNDVAIDYARYEPPRDEVGPLVGVSFCAGETETGFAGESDATDITAIGASILGIAHGFRVAAVEHFFDDIVIARRIEFRISQFEGRPVVVENPFKDIFAAGVIHDAPLRLTITKSAA